MTSVDLITGFLGAGKTTFIRKYADYLESKGEKVHIIENDFGNLPIDAELLQEENRDVSALTGGCLCCTGRTIFRDMLADAARKGFDRVIVEPSGIFDVNMFLSTLSAEPVSSLCRTGSIITVVDARPDQVLGTEAQHLIFSQLLYTGAVVFSKTQFYEPRELQSAAEQLQSIMEVHGAPGRLKDIPCLTKPWDRLEPADFDRLSGCGCRKDMTYYQAMDHMSVFSMTMMVGRFDTREHLDRVLQELLNTNRYGKVYRIKGFIGDMQGNMYAVSGTPGHWELQKVQARRGLFCVIGQDYDEKAVKALFQSLKNPV